MLSQVDPRINLWSLPPFSAQLWGAVIGVVLAGIGLLFAVTKAPTRLRRPLVWFFTFISGLFYVVYWIWPQPISRGANDLPRNSTEQFSFWLSDAQVKVADVANTLTAFLLCLGIYSLLRVHIGRIAKKHEDKFFSWVLLMSMLAILVFGYADWTARKFHDPESKLNEVVNWGWPQYGRDLLFDGFFQQMEAAMFSMIAFFILSAAYRAFRVRSVEATVLMLSALVLMISLMGGVVFGWNSIIDRLNVGEVHVLNNLKINEIANWVRQTLQTPSIRAVEFGVGLGALAMGLRLWLGLERGGVSS